MDLTKFGLGKAVTSNADWTYGSTWEAERHYRKSLAEEVEEQRRELIRQRKTEYFSRQKDRYWKIIDRGMGLYLTDGILVDAGGRPVTDSETLRKYYPTTNPTPPPAMCISATDSTGKTLKAVDRKKEEEEKFRKNLKKVYWHRYLQNKKLPY